MADSRASKKRVRDDSDESPDAKHFLLDILDDVDSGDRNPVTQDLASVMKSFEEEIGLLPPASTSDSGECKPDLGYLLEASDDELGIPPTISDAEKEKEESIDILTSPPEFSIFGQNWGFDDEIETYGPIGFGIPEENGNEDSVVFEGLFDYPDAFSGPSVFSDFSWRPEYLPAL